jgi:hypothetical protein
MSLETQEPKISCCQTHYPRYPYTHMQQSMDYCCIGCDKPGIGSNQHNPADNSNTDCAIVCCPCALIADILCCPFMVFGYYVVDNPN